MKKLPRSRSFSLQLKRCVFKPLVVSLATINKFVFDNLVATCQHQQRSGRLSSGRPAPASPARPCTCLRHKIFLEAQKATQLHFYHNWSALTTYHLLKYLLSWIHRHLVDLVRKEFQSRKGDLFVESLFPCFAFCTLCTMQNTHIFVPLCLDKVQLSIVSKGSPLCVDHHVLLLSEVPLVQCLNVLHVLQVAGVRPCPKNETDAAPVVLPCAAHKASSGVVEDGADVNLDVAPLVEGLVQQGHYIFAFDPLTVESLCPPDQAGLCQTLLPGFKVSKGKKLG